jgi:adenylate cyclase
MPLKGLETQGVTAVLMNKTSSFLISLVLALLLTGVAWLLGQTEVLERWEFTTLDLRFRTRAALQPKKPAAEITLVAIDDETVGDLGAWPFPRSTHAELLSLLAPEKPSVVAWDILFTEPKHDASELDARLVEAARLFSNFITSSIRDETNDRRIPPVRERGPTLPLANIEGNLTQLIQYKTAQLPFDYKTDLTDGTQMEISLLKNSYFGFADFDPSFDGVRRYAPVLIAVDDAVYPSLALQVVLLHYGVKPEEVRITLGKEIVIPGTASRAETRIPIDVHGQMLLNFRNPLENFTGISYSRLGAELNAKQNPEPGAPAPQLPPLAGQICMFGFTAKGFDTGSTPLYRNSPLVIFQLNAIDNILQRDFLQRVPLFSWLPGYFLIVLLTAWSMFHVPFVLRIFLAVISVFALVAAGWVLFLYANLWLPVFIPASCLLVAFPAVIGWQYLSVERDKRHFRKTLSSYLSEKVLTEVLSNPDKIKLGGTKKEITALFCDIRGFTKYCDVHAPEEVVGVLNEYLELMTDVILKYDGTLDKYIGDCIMAFWGAPQDQPDHAQRAVCCALEMRYALSAYKTTRAGVDTDLFECGIGIHTGDALVGNMGSSRHMNFTIIGSNVNLAARLEAMTKRLNCRILISEETRQRIEGEFTITDLGEVAVAGFAQKKRVYSVEPMQDIKSALSVGRSLASQASYTAEEVSQPLYAPAPLPEDAEEN